jgi:shikimate kinase
MIALIGLPGSGKSTVGRLLGRRLGLPFVDTDAAIESRLGCSIRSFFEREGEASFRDIETEVLAHLLSTQRQQVLSTGGGIVLRPANRALLQRTCKVIYLKSTPEDLYKRLRHDTQRPLLQVADPVAKLRELFTERDALYREVADFVLETGTPTVAALVNMAAMQLELAGTVVNS